MKNNKTCSLIFCSSVIFFLIILCTFVYSEMETGEAVMELPSGKRKSVIFPHKTHQETLDDCAICHKLFPMEKSAIRSLIKKGALKKKIVMNQCKGCHKALAKEKKNTGPTSCKACHTGKG